MPRLLMLFAALSTGVALVVGLLVGLGPVADAADGLWRAPLPDVDPSRVLTAPDGTTVVGNCSASEPRFALATLNSSGDVLSRVPASSDRPGLCGDASVRGADGTLFTMISRPEGEVVAAYRDGEQPAWTSALPCREPAAQLAVAGDGGVYVSYRCPNADRSLRRLEPANGSVTDLPTTGPPETGPGGFRAFRDGLVLTDIAPPALRFVGLNGAPGPVVGLPGEDGDFFYDLRVSDDGRAIVRFYDDRPVTADCPYSQEVTRIVAVDVATPSSPLRWDYPPCSSGGPVESTPGKGVLAGWVDSGGSSHLLRLDDRLGQAVWGYDIPSQLDGKAIRQENYDAVVDGTGRVLVSVQLDKPDDDRDVLFIPLDGKGVPGPAIDTQSIDPQARFSRDSSRYGIAPGRLNFLGRDCTDYGYLCFGPSVAYGVPLPGFTLDYPRSAILGAPVAPPDSGCGDAALLGLRGSGDNTHGDTWPGDQARAVADRLQRQHRVRLYRGGAVGVRYDAVPVNPLQYRAGDKPYLDSMRTGSLALRDIVRDVHFTCGAGFPILLVGFSQGAHAIHDTMVTNRNAEFASWVTGVVLLASPRFDPADPVARGTFPRDASSAGTVSGGALRGERVPAPYASKTRSYCRAGDPVCALTPANATLAGAAFHIGGYGPGGPDADRDRILDDAAAFLDWTARRPSGVDPVGDLEAFATSYPVPNIRASLMQTVLSAAAYYPRGVPTVRFDWDTDGDGRYDQVTTKAWTASLPRFVRTDRPARGPEQATVKVRVRFADGTVNEVRACVRPNRVGPASRC